MPLRHTETMKKLPALAVSRPTLRKSPRGDGADIDQPDEAAEKATVRREVDELRGFVKGLSLDDLRDGDWFAKLLTFSLGKYVQEVDAAYFTAKYPNLPADAVVQARIQMAARYASIEGGLTSAAYTGAVAGTIGTGGGASPLAVSGGLAAFAVDLTYSSQLQLRLAYDIAVLYRVPLDMNDPDDLWKLIRIAFGIKAGEVGTGGALKAVPAVVRPLVRKVFSGSTLTAVRSLPVVGKHLLQRNLVKFAIPAVGVPLTVAGNYWVTKLAGEHAKKVFRTEARVIEAAGRIVDGTSDHDALLWVLWMVIQADGHVADNERLLLHHVARVAEGLSQEAGKFDGLKLVIELDEALVWSKVASAVDSRTLYDAAVTAAAIDGHITKQERKVLSTLAGRVGATYDEESALAMAKSWA